jgi:hypothetical protein
MLLLITWASLAFNNPPLAQLSCSTFDTVKRQEQDSVARKDSNKSQVRPSVQEQPSIRKRRSPLNSWTVPEFHGSAIDTILIENPTLRHQFLRNLLIPSEPFIDDPAAAALKPFNERLERASKFTPFERMSVIAKRDAIYNPSDKSLKSYQLDIRKTIQWWLEEVLK